jgi:predicted Ser/Thr protein kinase
MNAEQWVRVRELFELALDRQGGDLEAWLDERAGDADVRREVASLLRHHSGAGSFLSAPVADRVPGLLDEDTRFQPEQRVGDYAIVRELGRGGMGRVYLATDVRLGRTVALKALPPHLTRDPAQRERLRREARAAAALSHPGICTIYALEELNDELFIAAEYIDGRTLRQEIAQGRRPSPRDLLEMAEELAAALAAAHAKGITHRDLKPENVMRAPDGRLKILDFGLALIDPVAGPFTPTNVTQPGTLVGTPGYMAPEQLNGGPVDARADVFALGVLLYECACGTHPFQAASPLALAARVLEGEPRPIQTVCPDIPPVVASVIDRCLTKAPRDRFASAVDVALALARTDVPRPSTGVTTWWRAHQLTAIGLYLVAAVLAWRIKEWQHGLPDQLFLAVGILATVAAMFRGHLLFTEKVNRGAFDAERRRAVPVTLGTDLLIALVVFADGVWLASTRPLPSVLTLALAVGIAVARLVLEPATTAGAFGSPK